MRNLIILLASVLALALTAACSAKTGVPGITMVDPSDHDFTSRTEMVTACADDKIRLYEWIWQAPTEQEDMRRRDIAYAHMDACKAASEAIPQTAAEIHDAIRACKSGVIRAQVKYVRTRDAADKQKALDAAQRCDEKREQLLKEMPPISMEEYERLQQQLEAQP